VDKKKLLIIPYFYYFSKYQQPDPQEVEKIKMLYPCRLRLIMVSRLIRLKQHHIVFPVIKKLVNEGYDLKLLVLDEGPEKQYLENYITANQLQEHIFMLGFRKDFVHFMAASDLLVQPSLTDASNSAAKEMAFFEKPVAVSTQVGDYDDYVIDHVNGYLLPTTNTAAVLEQVIREVYENPEQLKELGKRLKNDVISRFDRSPQVVDQYIALIAEHVIRKTGI
jgi:glycosyltransferase involved in cell wall biosynthesis